MHQQLEGVPAEPCTSARTRLESKQSLTTLDIFHEYPYASAVALSVTNHGMTKLVVKVGRRHLAMPPANISPGASFVSRSWSVLTSSSIVYTCKPWCHATYIIRLQGISAA